MVFLSTRKAIHFFLSVTLCSTFGSAADSQDACAGKSGDALEECFAAQRGECVNFLKDLRKAVDELEKECSDSKLGMGTNCIEAATSCGEDGLKDGIWSLISNFTGVSAPGESNACSGFYKDKDKKEVERDLNRDIKDAQKEINQISDDNIKAEQTMKEKLEEAEGERAELDKEIKDNASKMSKEALERQTQMNEKIRQILTQLEQSNLDLIQLEGARKDALNKVESATISNSPTVIYLECQNKAIKQAADFRLGRATSANSLSGKSGQLAKMRQECYQNGMRLRESAINGAKTIAKSFEQQVAAKNAAIGRLNEELAEAKTSNSRIGEIANKEQQDFEAYISQKRDLLIKKMQNAVTTAQSTLQNNARKIAQKQGELQKLNQKLADLPKAATKTAADVSLAGSKVVTAYSMACSESCKKNTEGKLCQNYEKRIQSLESLSNSDGVN